MYNSSGGRLHGLASLSDRNQFLPRLNNKSQMGTIFFR